jgi:hypothetical protein
VPWNILFEIGVNFSLVSVCEDLAVT